MVLSIFVSLFKFRVPEFAKEQQHLRREILRKLGPMVERTSRLSRSETPKPLISPTGERSYDLAEVIEEIEALETDADASHNDVLRMVVPLTGEISRYILQMDWIIARSPADASFVTTDNPFVLTAPHGYDPQSPFGVGIATLGAQEIIPLTARPCLVILDKGSSVDFANISRAEVRRINLAVALNCDRYLFARDEAQIRNVVKRTIRSAHAKGRNPT